jgi:hypothetical protein
MSTLDLIAQEQPRYAGACYALMRCLSSDTLDENTHAVVRALTPPTMWQLVELIVQRCATISDVEAQLPELVREVIAS